MTDPMEYLRDKDGKLPKFAWPGGYRINYICEDGGYLCADCANENQDPDDPQWNVVGHDIYWEGPDNRCDHCNKVLAAEYSDPWEEVEP